jgi:hypothetical protein
VATQDDRWAWTEVNGERVTLTVATALEVDQRAHIAAIRINAPWWRISEADNGGWFDTDDPPRRNPNYKPPSDPLAQLATHR